MKISYRGFAENTHSWGTCSQNIVRGLKNFGHDVHICSTNGYKFFPEDLIENIKCKECTVDLQRRNDKCKLDKEYDMQLSYTANIHWHEYLANGNKNKFVIYNYDGTVLPAGWAKFYKHVDRVLPSSKFSYDVFKANGIPENIMTIVPHGVSDEFLTRTNKYTIKTDRKYKILLNIAQPHTRKNLNGVLEAWGKAFTAKDDVVLVAKVKIKKPEQIFEVSWTDELLKAKKKYNLAPIMIINDFIPNISDLYRSCDICFSSSHVECFHLPSLEMMSLGKITIASNYGGNVDFMNDNNSLLINGKVGRAPTNFQYWSSSVHGQCFFPDANHAAELLKLSVNKYDELKSKFAPELEKIKEKYTWNNVAKQILSLAGE